MASTEAIIRSYNIAMNDLDKIATQRKKMNSLERSGRNEEAMSTAYRPHSNSSAAAYAAVYTDKYVPQVGVRKRSVMLHWSD